MEVGLEGALGGSSTYLQTVKCISAYGEVTDPSLIDLYKNIIKDVNCYKDKLAISTAVYYKIKRETFMKIIV